MRFVFIGDSDTAAGFRLAGIGVQVTETPEETWNAVERAVKDHECGIIIITEAAADDIRDLQSNSSTRTGTAVGRRGTGTDGTARRAQKPASICPGSRGHEHYPRGSVEMFDWNNPLSAEVLREEILVQARKQAGEIIERARQEAEFFS